MGKIHDLTGQVFSRLTVVGDSGRRQCMKVLWECRCACGRTAFATGQDLIQGKCMSCGCLSSEITAERNRQGATHRCTKTNLYRKWQGMKSRCRPGQNKNYGARGITVCDEWAHDFLAFKAWAETHGYRQGLSIERIDVDKGYSPDNCSWVTNLEQQRNKRDTIRYQGRSLRAWAEERGLNLEKVCNRVVRLNWTCEEALEMVPHKRNHEQFLASKAYQDYLRRPKKERHHV